MAVAFNMTNNESPDSDDALIVLTSEGVIQSFTPTATRFYGLVPSDIGRPLWHFACLVSNSPSLPQWLNPASDLHKAIKQDPFTPQTILTAGCRRYVRRIERRRKNGTGGDEITIRFTALAAPACDCAAPAAAQSHGDLDQDAEVKSSIPASISDSLPALIAYIDKCQRYRYVNHAFAKQFGRPIHDIIGRHVSELLGNDYEFAKDRLEAAMRGERQCYEIAIHPFGDDRPSLKEATYVPDIDSDGAVMGCYLLATDITDRKHWEWHLQTQEANLRMVIDHLLAFVGIVDQEGTIREANQASLQIANLTREQVVGKKLWECYWYDDDETAVANLKRAFQLALSGETVRYDQRLRVSDHQRIVIDFMLQPVRNTQGEVTHVVSSGVDITDRKNAEVRLAERAKLAGLHAELAIVLSHPHSRDEILRACCQALVERLQLPLAAVWLVDENHSSLQLAANAGDDGLVSPEVLRSQIGPEIVRRLQKCREPIYSDSCSDVLSPAAAPSPMVRSFGGFPLVLEGRFLGAVAIFSHNPISNEAFEDMRPMADAIAQCVRRKEVETEIIDNERRLRLILEANHMGSWEWDLDSGKTFFDKGQYEVFGWPHGIETDVNRFFDSIHPEDLPRITNALKQSIGSGADYEEDFRFVQPDGEVRWIAGRGSVVKNEAGRVIRMIGLNWDVTSQKQTDEKIRESEQRLRESEERYRLAIAAANLGTWRINLDSQMVERDATINQMLGLDKRPTQVPLDDFFNRLHADDHDRIAVAIRQAVESNCPYDLTFRVVHPSGEVRWIRDKARPFMNDDANRRYWIGAAMDITEQKAFEHSLDQARQVAEAANRSRGEFVANMSHEIRTPMTAILGYTEILSSRLQDMGSQECLETIRRNGQYLLEIINDILDLSKIDAGKIEIEREAVRLQSLTHDIHSLMNIRAREKRISLESRFDGAVPAQIETDPVRLRQILLNLLGNAIKFTESGSVQLVVRHFAETKQIQFDIVDTGIGISNQDLATLFEPFTQADASATRTYGGTGLGLTISRRLARVLGGDISVTSELNRGSTFSLTIDCNVVTEVEPAAPSPITQSPMPVADAQLRLNGCVLVVDDRRDIRYVAQHFIECAGGKVILASNGQEAVDMLMDTEKFSVIDLILMDMQMPVMDGYEATRRLRTLGYSRPIIALTAHAMKSDRDKCSDAGCTDYTTKPLQRTGLLRLLSQHLEHSKSDRGCV